MYKQIIKYQMTGFKTNRLTIRSMFFIVCLYLSIGHRISSAATPRPQDQRSWQRSLRSSGRWRKHLGGETHHDGRVAQLQSRVFFPKKMKQSDTRYMKIYENHGNNVGNNPVYLAILCDLFGMSKWPFQRLSDLQLGDIERPLWITWYSYYDIWFRYVIRPNLWILWRFPSGSPVQIMGKIDAKEL